MPDDQMAVTIPLLDSVEDILFLLDADRRFTFVNAFALRTWNRQAHDLLGNLLEDGLPRRPSQETIDFFQSAFWTRTRCEFESSGFTAEGNASITLSPYQGGLIVHCRRLFSSIVSPTSSADDLHGPPESGPISRWNDNERAVRIQGEDIAALKNTLNLVDAHVTPWTPDSRTFRVEMSIRPADAEQRQEQSVLSPGTAAGSGKVHPFVAFSRQLEELQNSNDIIMHTLGYLLTGTEFDLAAYIDCEGEQVSFSQWVTRPGLPDLALLSDVQPLLNRLLPEMRRTRATAWTTDDPAGVKAVPSPDTRIPSALLTPVFRKGEVVAGILLLAAHHVQVVAPHTRQGAELTALHLEHALEFCRIAGEDRSTLASSVLSLSIALEARDIETHRHTQRTALMAVQFGERLGLQEPDLEHLRQSAYLHDLGKLCIPDAILQCSGRLTAEAWQVMQTHTTSGWALASRIPGLSPAVLEVIRHHHEHWDGSGYPDGLAGEEMPLLARLVAVCDVYDALISERPYKQAWSVEATLEEIQAQSGRLFDPEIVRAFLVFSQAPS
ncbi:HD domain-containing phosphohydrolase [Deinococcus altitudinis]|uniref:HD domain-containing phosphohydrolase n=1 Tax=Deinococcus altitudinis TaxID=468914 RepID=UPI003891C279